MRCFLTLFALSAVALCLLSLTVAVAVCAAQNPGAGAVAITEQVTFSWQIVIMIAVSAAGYAGTIASIRQHIGDKSIHLREADIEARHPLRRECDPKHAILDREIDELKKSA